MTESISAFLLRAFPQGTLPFPRDIAKDPTAKMHYAHNLVGWKAGNEKATIEAMKKAGTLTQLWPVWPPDMFAAVATLLEQSAAYLKMVYCGPGANELAPGDAFAADRILAATKRHGNLSFPNRVLKVCRIVGALWREGCLFISGDGGLPQIENHPGIQASIIAALRERCFDALHGLETGFHSEFDEGDVDELCREAIQTFKTKCLIDGGQDCDFHWPSDSPAPIKGYLLANILTDYLKEKPAKEVYRRPRQRDMVTASQYVGRFEIALALWAIDFVQTLWDTVNNSPGSYLSSTKGKGSGLEDWQIASALLMAIADEAGCGIGFSSAKPQSHAVTAVSSGDRKALESNDYIGQTCRDLWESHATVLESNGYRPRNLARSVDEAIATVMPKARVPVAGCTLRSLSHHLALLPPKGRIRTRWVQQKEVDEHPTFNLLLVPYPYEIHSMDVVPDEKDLANRDMAWGRFTIEPNWLIRSNLSNRLSKPLNADKALEQFLNFLDALVNDQPANTIDGIVFPEGSLTDRYFRAVADRILSNGPNWASITFLTAGLTDRKVSEADKAATKGNFVATYLRERGGAAWHTQHARSKHHRWSLNKPQLASYALSNRLPPDKIWWENIELPPREMLFAEFSKGSILTSLICEDLARIDPCQAALRAIGPNLTLVLLMDSAQIASRWPAQYAGVLADDPGTSVLTLTSFGLLRRSNLSDGHSSRAIALWREPQGRVRQIDLPKGYHAQLLALRRDKAREVTLDGRGDGRRAIIWRLAGVVPIRVDEAVLPPGFPPEGC